MSILSEDVFLCLDCSRPIVYEPFHTTGVENCNNCSTKHLIKVGKITVVKYDETISEQANKAKLEIESWPDWKKEYYYKLLKEFT